jgi:hypothetical protein
MHTRTSGLAVVVLLVAVASFAQGTAKAPPSKPAAPAAAQAASPGVRALGEMVDFLLGQWIGEGSGEPGQGSGTFSFEASLDGNLVTRRSHAEYPAAQGRPAVNHVDVMVMYPEGGQVRADYFDNEGHVIHYTVAFTHQSATLTFISGIVEGQPRYRLVYRPLATDRVETTFEIAPPGKADAFATYVKGTSKRVK